MEAFIKFGTIVGVVVALVLSIFAITKIPGIQQVVSYGATPGADSQYACETHNGVQTCFANVGFSQATTTVCSIKSPTATSTFSDPPIMTVSTGITVASTLTIAKGTNTNASTTLIQAGTLAAGAQGTMVASSSAYAQIDGATVLAPNTYVNFSMSGATSYSSVGRCIAQFESVNTSNR